MHEFHGDDEERLALLFVKLFIGNVERPADDSYNRRLHVLPLAMDTHSMLDSMTVNVGMNKKTMRYFRTLSSGMDNF